LEGGEEVRDDGGGADRAEGLGGLGADFGVGVLESGAEGVEHHLLMLGIVNHRVCSLVWLPWMFTVPVLRLPTWLILSVTGGGDCWVIRGWMSLRIWR
jgi:hypothetical protein